MGRFPSQQGLAPKPTNGVQPNDRPPPQPKPAGPLFSTDDEMQPDMRSAGAGLTGMGANSRAGAEAEDLGSYNAGALLNPDAGLATNVPIAEGRKRKLPPAVAIGWGVLALLLIMLAAMVALSPKTVVSLLPGSARLYAMMGKPVSALGVKIENVRSAWSYAGAQLVLQVDGDIVNLTAKEVVVPTVEITLQDKSGKQLSQSTANVLALGAGAKTSFSVQIPGAPENVSSLKVRFAKPK
jgi:hypothetical protein